MKIIQGSRSAGKTHKLAKIVKKDPNSLLLTFSEAEANRISRTYGIPKNQVRSYRNTDRNDYKERVYIDNLDIILANLVGTTTGQREIVECTMTGPLDVESIYPTQTISGDPYYYGHNIYNFKLDFPEFSATRGGINYNDPPVNRPEDRAKNGMLKVNSDTWIRFSDISKIQFVGDGSAKGYTNVFTYDSSYFSDLTADEIMELWED